MDHLMEWGRGINGINISDLELENVPNQECDANSRRSKMG